MTKLPKPGVFGTWKHYFYGFIASNASTDDDSDKEEPSVKKSKMLDQKIKFEAMSADSMQIYDSNTLYKRCLLK